MADLKRVPGCHVYWGPSPVAPGIAKLPKEKVIVFNIEGEAEAELKDVPAVKTPFDKERPVPLASFDVIVQALVEEDDGHGDLRGVEPGAAGGEAALGEEQVAEVPAAEVLHHQEQPRPLPA